MFFSGKLDDLGSYVALPVYVTYHNTSEWRTADCNRTQSPSHCLSHLLPLEKHHLVLRPRGYRYDLPMFPNNLCKRSFVPRSLFCFYDYINQRFVLYQCKKTYQFKAQCKGDISRAFKTAKITVFDTMMCKRPDVPLQAELLALTVQLRTSQPSILAVLHGWEY